MVSSLTGLRILGLDGKNHNGGDVARLARPLAALRNLCELGLPMRGADATIIPAHMLAALPALRTVRPMKLSDMIHDLRHLTGCTRWSRTFARRGAQLELFQRWAGACACAVPDMSMHTSQRGLCHAVSYTLAALLSFNPRCTSSSAMRWSKCCHSQHRARAHHHLRTSERVKVTTAAEITNTGF